MKKQYFCHGYDTIIDKESEKNYNERSDFSIIFYEKYMMLKEGFSNDQNL